MKPHFEQIFYSNEESIHADEFSSSYFTAPLHFHPEYENAGCLVLLGPNLPHVWINSEVFYRNRKADNAKCIVIHFGQFFFPKETLELPEFKYISKILDEAANGIKITGKDVKRLSSLIKEMPHLRDVKRYTSLLSILEIMAKSKSAYPLAGKGYVNTLDHQVPERLNKVISFVNANYKEKIRLLDAANIASMNKTAFCRYFKEKTGKSFTKYVNEIRISYACKLLIDEKFNVLQICYESGFNNLSNFHRQFKSILKKTPLEYLDDWKGI